jgi:hypothetical protein
MVKFFEPTPTFGTKHKRLEPSKQQLSPYYWWWAYLRCNKDYLACCEKGGKGKFAKLYADFGDVRGDDFRLWWRAKGVELFAEQISIYKFKEIDSKDEVPERWRKDDFIFLQVPLTYDKKSLKKYFNQLLMDRHQRGRGRPTQKTRASSAKYPLNGTYTIANLRLCLQVYERYLETRSGSNKLKLWELAVEMRLLPEKSMPNPKDDYADRLVKRNRLQATVGRYIKQAKTRIDKAAIGQFPVA